MAYTPPDGSDPAPNNRPPRPSWQPPEPDEDDTYYDLSDKTGAARSKSTGNPFAPNPFAAASGNVPLPPVAPTGGVPPGGVPPGVAPASSRKPAVTPFAPPGWNAAELPQSGGGDRVRLYLGLGIIAAALLVLIYVLKSIQPPVVPAPLGFVSFTAVDHSFQCQAPQSWTLKARNLPGGGTESRFEKKFASVVITSLPAGSSTLAALDASSAKAAAGGMSHYAELPAQPFPSEMGDGHIAQWTARGNLITKQLRGYRVAILGNGRAITVLCSCSDRNWKALQPAFFQVASSIAPVPAQSP